LKQTQDQDLGTRSQTKTTSP